MNRWVLLGGGALLAVAAFVRSRSRPSEPEPVGYTLPDTSVPDFPAVEVQPGRFLAVTAAPSFLAMQAEAAARGISLPLTTAWRSRAFQQRLYDAWTAYQAGTGPKANLAAKPDKSLHEKGIAVDIAGVNPATSGYNPQRAEWLKANAERFDWYNTGAYFSSPEPWHWVYGIKREGLVSAVV